MTVNYKADAILDIRKFLWSELKTSNIFDQDAYWSDNLNENVVPIIPVQQAPELNHFLSGKKHIVYDKVGISYETN